ncbi:hypothetical protein ASF29_11425 [Rhizobium sp. Leaf262]|nr:hypothetical protein ASF29_11425 [Rhizobium sp. Leaf262]
MAICEYRVLHGVVNVGTFDVKAVFKRIRFSRKFVLIGSGVLLLGGASGVAAIMVGKQSLFGEAQASVNGLECKMVQTVNVKKNGAVWIRKFIRTEGGDGAERIKTALRIAKAVYNEQKPDLVQISILDKNGPTMRSDMRGRAVAAQVVFIPDVAKLPADADAKTYSAYYYEGAPSAEGVFYGLRIDLPLEDTEKLAASLTDFTPCIDPAAESAPAGGHGAASSGHEKTGGGHGEAAPSEAGHGGAPAAGHDGGHGEPSAKDGHSAPDDPQLLTSAAEHDSASMFSFPYLKSLIFGKGSTTAVAAEPEHGSPVADAGHDAPPAAEASH